MPTIRLQKYLADCGIASRRKSEELIQAGLVKVNGTITTQLGTKIDTEKDKVEYQNKTIKPESKFIYIMLNKQAHYVTSLSHKGKKTILDLIDIKERIFPVGRLDELSEGLLILTNDGDFAYKLTHPKFEHEKEYIVELFYPITNTQITQLEKGIVLEGVKTYPTKVKQINEKTFSITVHEGRNRQIRRMCLALNLKIKALKRVRVGDLLIGNLKPGSWRHLTEEEVGKLISIDL